MFERKEGRLKKRGRESERWRKEGRNMTVITNCDKEI